MNIEANLLMSKIAIILLVALAGAATILIILFPPTETMWPQRTRSDKFIRISSAALIFILYLKIASDVVPNLFH